MEGKKTITLTVNRMLTGSTVEEWDTMLFLKDTASPQEYDQAVFRLQNQYVKKYADKDGNTIKYNMKPQTLLVDFMPGRMFSMQEQKSQIYNVNVDEAGNSRLEERIREELRISPIVVVNSGKMEQVRAGDILHAVSEYSKNRGVAEEATEIPVDLSLMDIDAIRAAIEKENELGSKQGFSTKAHDGDGDGTDMDIPDDTDRTDDDTGENRHNEDPDADTHTEQDRKNTREPSKQIKSYYARILFFAFLTKDVVISLEDIIVKIDTDENSRIAHHIGISKSVLEPIFENINKFVLRDLDYSIQRLNRLSHDDTVDPIERANVAVRKFGKLGESEVITPKKICDEMVALIPSAGLIEAVQKEHKILDIAGKAGEFALAVYERMKRLEIEDAEIANAIYTIPTSGITYEFTRMVYEILGLNVHNLSNPENLTSYRLLDIKNHDGTVDYEQIKALLMQNKPFDEIKPSDVIAEGDEKVKFDVVVGNPPYQEAISESVNNDSLGKQLFPWFVMCSTKITSKYASMITPSRWFTGDAQDKSFVKLRHYMQENNHIKKMVNYKDEKEVFSGVEIKGGISYFLYEQSYSGQVEFINISKGIRDVQARNLFENGLDIIISDSINYPLICKVKTNNFIPLTTITTGRNAFGIIGKPSIVNSVSEKDRFQGACELRCKANVIRWINPDLVIKNRDIFEKYKVFISKSAGNPNSDAKVIGYPYVGGPNSACTDSLIPIGKFDTLEEAENLAKYIKTKFLRYMVSILKTSQNVTQIVYEFVPMQDFTVASDIDWSKTVCEIDAQLYAKYNLTHEEIAFI